MPAIARKDDLSTGHGCFPPTALTVTVATKSYFNGKLVALKDSGTQFVQHVCGRTTHTQSQRFISSGSSKTFIEGKAVARIGDDIACGDAIAQGSPNSFVE